MAGTKGYSNYRGRGSKWKVLLGFLLVLILLAAAAVWFMQKNIVYDETGLPQLKVPWQKDMTDETPEEQPLDLELIIQEPEIPPIPEIRAFSLPIGTLTEADCNQALATADPACDTVVVTMKDNAGRVYFDSAIAVSGSVRTKADTGAALAALMENDFHTIAAISCFLDSRAANSDVEGLGLKNTGGYIFYDGNNHQWLDPAKPAARQYLCELAKEVANLGFDEILLADVSYPTEGKLNKIAYGETVLHENLLTFLKEMRAALEPYDVILSIRLPAEVIATGNLEEAGLVLEEILPQVDRVCAAAAPENVEAFASVISDIASTVQFTPELAGPAAQGSFLIP